MHSTAGAASAGGRTSMLKVDRKGVASEKMDRTVPLSCNGTRPLTSAPNTGTPIVLNASYSGCDPGRVKNSAASLRRRIWFYERARSEANIWSMI